MEASSFGIETDYLSASLPVTTDMEVINCGLENVSPLQTQRIRTLTPPGKLPIRLKVDGGTSKRITPE
jgi:hypothetical protein